MMVTLITLMRVEFDAGRLPQREQPVGTVF
jgi:hypothetical protein